MRPGRVSRYRYQWNVHRQLGSKSIAMDGIAHAQGMDLLRALLERRWATTPLDPWAYSFQYLSGPIPFNCYVQINPDMEGLLFRAQLGGASLEIEHYPRMAQLCETLNLEVPVGCFSFNSSNGDVRWKSGVYFRKQELTEQMIRNVIDPALLHIDNAIHAIVSIHSGQSLEVALSRVGDDLGIGTSESCHYRFEPHPRGHAE
jgi:hypothetical protein